jgi:hypothetical protein
MLFLQQNERKKEMIECAVPPLVTPIPSTPAVPGVKYIIDSYPSTSKLFSLER